MFTQDTDQDTEMGNTNTTPVRSSISPPSDNPPGNINMMTISAQALPSPPTSPIKTGTDPSVRPNTNTNTYKLRFSTILQNAAHLHEAARADYDELCRVLQEHAKEKREKNEQEGHAAGTNPTSPPSSPDSIPNNPIVTTTTTPYPFDAFEHASLCQRLRIETEDITMMESTCIPGWKYVNSLDRIMRMLNAAQSVVFLDALENVGREFKGESAKCSEQSTENGAPVTTPESGVDMLGPMAELEQCISPYQAMATKYAKKAKKLYEGGTTSLHTYEFRHNHIMSTCTIKHEHEIYPFGFNPKLMRVLGKCSRSRLKREQQERVKRILKERKRTGRQCRHAHRNPVLSEDVIKECGDETYRDLEGIVDMEDLKDAADWELSTRRLAEKTSKKKNAKKPFQRTSPLRYQMQEMEDRWISVDTAKVVVKLDLLKAGKVENASESVNDKKRKGERDGLEEEEGRETKRVRNTDLEMGCQRVSGRLIEKELERLQKNGMMGVLKKEQRRSDKEAKRKHLRKKEMAKEFKKMDRIEWENRERSDSLVTQAWIDLGVNLARIIRWERLR